ncbi:MAG: energy-coupling factor transporter transmembrane component T [Deltaproteobacteria bacterium]
MKDFFKSFNTLALIIYLTCMLIFVSVTNNPAVQIIFFGSICLLIMSADRKAIKNALILAAFIGIPIMLINPIVNSRGATVLFRLTEVPVFGDIKITLECLIFALVLMLKLVNTVLLFVFLNICVEADKIFNLISFAAPRSAVTAALTAKMIPSMMESTKRIAEVQMTRGVQLDSKNIFKRIKAGWPFIKILLFSSLEGSMQTAEALESKGYGAAKRRRHYDESFGLKDFWLIFAGIMVVFITIFNYSGGFLAFKFFPRLGFTINNAAWVWIVVGFLPLLVIMPAILSWRSDKCKTLK